MKKQDLIARIKETAIEEMPDVLHKIDISKVVIEDKPETIRSPFNFRKAISYTFASIFILISGITVFNFIAYNSDTTPLESDTEIVGFQTISAASLLQTFDVVDLSETSSVYNVIQLSETTTAVDDSTIIDQIYLVNNYLNMAETVLVDQNQYLYEDMESDNLEYAYAFRYNGTDLLGNLISYRGYYNIVEQDGYQMEVGVLIHDEDTYDYSSIVTDTEGVITYCYRISINSQNYVEVTNASTEDAQIFTYKVYKNNELFNQSEISLIRNKESLKAKIKITNRLNQEIELDVERDMTEKTNQKFKVNYKISENQSASQTEGEITVSLQYNEETGKYQYQYQINNQEVIIEDRPKKGNQQATEDDFKPGRVSQNPFVTTATSSTEEDTDRPGQGNTDNHNNSPRANQPAEIDYSSESITL